MHRSRHLLLLAAILAATPLAALEISGPTQSPPHKLVRLEAVGAAKTAALIWDVYPEDQVDLEESGGRLLLAAPPGTYKIKLRAIEGAKVETARATLTIGTAPPTPPGPPAPNPPGPTPPPPRPEPAPGRFGVAPVVFRGVLALPDPARARAPDVAAAFEGIAAAIAAGGLTRGADVDQRTQQALASAYGDQAALWQPIDRDVYARLKTQVRSLADVAEAYREIAAGIRAAIAPATALAEEAGP